MSIEDYHLKRKTQVFIEAEQNLKYLIKKYNKVSEEIKMKNFRVLYMPRTKQNIDRYCKENGCIGVDPQLLTSLLCKTTPLYSSYEDFVYSILNKDKEQRNPSVTIS